MQQAKDDFVEAIFEYAEEILPNIRESILSLAKDVAKGTSSLDSTIEALLRAHTKNDDYFTVLLTKAARASVGE